MNGRKVMAWWRGDRAPEPGPRRPPRPERRRGPQAPPVLLEERNQGLALRAVRGLRIADASVVPTTPVSAMNAPSMLIGWRAARFAAEAGNAKGATSS